MIITILFVKITAISDFEGKTYYLCEFSMKTTSKFGLLNRYPILC